MPSRTVFALTATLLSTAGASAATFVVNTTADAPDATPGDGICRTAGGVCTLRAAIQEANVTTASDTIAFGIAGSGVHTLRPASPLPLVTQPVIIDGFTQPGSLPNTSTDGINAMLLVELDLSMAGGMTLTGGSSTVRGLVLNGAATSPALVFRTRWTNAVEGCFIGTNAAGTAARGNATGVELQPDTFLNRIGGNLPAQRNLISGNGTGIRFVCPSSSGCHNPSYVWGNLIGTNASGTAAIPNLGGIVAENARGLRIGGSSAGMGNVISGNLGDGIDLGGGPPTQPSIQGNRIGTSANGTNPLGNGRGVRLRNECYSCSPSAIFIVGGLGAEGNLIAFNGVGVSVTGGGINILNNAITANATRGIELTATAPPNILISGNIWLNTFTANGSAAVDVDGYSAVAISQNVVTANGAVGGTAAILIKGNLSRVTANSIQDNAGLGIDIRGDGPTPNDPGDGDTGPNELQNFPVLASACSSGGNVSVRGSLNSQASTSYTVEFFRSPACDPSGYGEGETFLGNLALTTGADGNAAFTSSQPVPGGGGFVTATATSPYGGTSEFSQCVPVFEDSPPPPQTISGPASVCAGSPFLLKAVVAVATYQWYLNGVAIPGATGPSYGRSAAAGADTGPYTVRASRCGFDSVSPPHNLLVVACAALPLGLDVDRHSGAGTVSDLNGVLEPSEVVLIEPRYRNDSGGALTLAGTATLTGPAGGVYALPDPTASYGTVAPTQVTDCFGATGDCYRGAVSSPAGRPIRHWDAILEETTSGGSSPPRQWPLHIGETFADVPRADLFYRFIEAMVHNGVTAGCSATNYCSPSRTTREQLAVFVLVAREGPFYAPPACNPAAPRFSDVPAGSPFCRWIEELARRGVVGGCGPNLYCPLTNVPRDQMAVFVLATREPPGYAPPPCVAGSEVFADVPASSPFCRWVEELARRNVVGGCGNGNYCPSAAVTRGEMSVFIVATFGLLLYGP